MQIRLAEGRIDLDWVSRHWGDNSGVPGEERPSTAFLGLALARSGTIGGRQWTVVGAHCSDKIACDESYIAAGLS